MLLGTSDVAKGHELSVSEESLIMSISYAIGRATKSQISNSTTWVRLKAYFGR